MHTKEPWIIDEYGTVLANGHTLIVAGMALSAGRKGDIEVANSRRIVACVNACAGFANPEKDIPAIETASKMHFDQAMANGQRASEYEAQRDELLAALKDALQFVSDHVNFGGKYPYINGTELVRDAYKVLKQIDEVIAKYES